MEPRVLLRRFATALTLVTAVAFSLCAAEAYAWGTPKNPTSGTVRVSVPNGSTAPAMCPTKSGESTAPDVLPACGHQEFTFFEAGILTMTVTVDCSSLPSNSEADCSFQQISPQMCLEGAPAPGGNCPVSGPSEGFENQDGCDNAMPADQPNADGSLTWTIVCDIGPSSDSTAPSTVPVTFPAKYELVIAPSPVDTCPPVFPNPDDLFPVPDPDAAMCHAFMSGPPITAIVTYAFTSGKFVVGDGPAKVSGAGKLGEEQAFALHGENTRTQKTHIRYARHTRDSTKCYFWADGASAVNIVRNPGGGGFADISGTGWVKNSRGKKTQVNYSLHVTDGNGAADTFSLTAPGCDNSGPTAQKAVTKGDIKIDQRKERKKDEHWHDD